MDNVILFPGSISPELKPVSPSDILKTTEGYELHQQEIKDWLFDVASHNLAGKSAFLDTVNERYGLPKISEEDQEQWTRETIYDDPRSVSFELQYAHIRAVIVSPILSIYQKTDLLTISANSLYETELPADGRRVVLRDIEKVNRKVGKVFKSYEGFEEEKYNELTEHLESLHGLIAETFPKLTRIEFYKKAASSISGESVTSIFKALGIYFAELEKPSPQEIEIAKARDGARKEREKQRAEKELLDAAAKYHELLDNSNR